MRGARTPVKRVLRVVFPYMSPQSSVSMASRTASWDVPGEETGEVVVRRRVWPWREDNITVRRVPDALTSPPDTPVITPGKMTSIITKDNGIGGSYTAAEGSVKNLVMSSPESATIVYTNWDNLPIDLLWVKP